MIVKEDVEISTSSHLRNEYPSVGEAVILTSVHSWYSPPSVETVPPSLVETVNV